jgi:hypothetical protein
MATRSTIGYRTPEGRIVSVYCHWDGYVSNNGRILQENYQAAYKIAHLIGLGGISSLKAEIGEKHGFSYRETDMTDEAFEAAYGNMTTFYARDRGEELSIQIYNDAKEFVDNGEEYNYLWNGTEWLVNDHGAISADGFPVFELVSTLLAQENQNA